MAANKIQRADPPYVQIVTAITERIAAGDLTPGERVPTEVEIRETWGVSRATANKVAAELKASGIAYTRPGYGLIVRAQSRNVAAGPASMWQRIASTGEIRMPNEHSERRTGHAPASDAPEVVVAALDATSFSELVYRHRVIYRDAYPFTVAVSWFLPALLDQQKPITDRLLENERIVEGTPRYIADQLGRDLTETTEVVGIVRATVDEAAALNIAEGDPLLRVVSTIFAEGWPIEVGTYVYPEAPEILTSRHAL